MLGISGWERGVSYPLSLLGNVVGGLGAHKHVVSNGLCSPDPTLPKNHILRKSRLVLGSVHKKSKMDVFGVMSKVNIAKVYLLYIPFHAR